MTANPATDTRRHAVGLEIPWWLWLILAGGGLGLIVDASLARTVMNGAFDQGDDISVWMATAIGLGAGVGAVEAAVAWNSRKKVVASIILGGVAALGIGLAWARVAYGWGDGAQQETDHVPGTVLMLALYFLSLIGVFSTAMMLFHPARTTLRRTRKELESINRERIALEGDLAGINARIDHGPDFRTELDASLAHTMDQIDARRDSLKALARDAIARAVGDPSATPLVRAPHEPAPPPDLKTVR